VPAITPKPSLHSARRRSKVSFTENEEIFLHLPPSLTLTSVGSPFLSQSASSQLRRSGRVPCTCVSVPSTRSSFHNYLNGFLLSQWLTACSSARRTLRDPVPFGRHRTSSRRRRGRKQRLESVLFKQRSNSRVTVSRWPRKLFDLHHSFGFFDTVLSWTAMLENAASSAGTHEEEASWEYPLPSMQPAGGRSKVGYFSGTGFHWEHRHDHEPMSPQHRGRNSASDVLILKPWMHMITGMRESRWMCFKKALFH
jgi:hypothetical protein